MFLLLNIFSVFLNMHFAVQQNKAIILQQQNFLQSGKADPTTTGAFKETQHLPQGTQWKR